jgi:hypothetical protein
VHQPEGNREHHRKDQRAGHERHPEACLLGEEAARDRSGEHRRPADDLAVPEDRFHLTGEAGSGERVDKPRLDRAGEERESEAEQDRYDRPLPERRLDLPEHDVEQRRPGQGHGAEQV